MCGRNFSSSLPLGIRDSNPINTTRPKSLNQSLCEIKREPTLFSCSFGDYLSEDYGIFVEIQNDESPLVVPEDQKLEDR